MTLPVLPAVASAIAEALAQGVAPAISAWVLHHGELRHASGDGRAQIDPEERPLGAGDLFDVASLTKVMATTTLAALACADGALRSNDLASRWLPAFAGPGKEGITLHHLLAHSSGLPAWRPFFELAMRDASAGLAFLPPHERPGGAPLSAAFRQGRALVRQAALSEPLTSRPGEQAVYCDLGFMALGWILEASAGLPLDVLAERRVFEPLGLADTFYVDEASTDAAAARRRGRSFVATERCIHRQEVNCGTVNDDNAWAMGGVAGHAGLFSTARDVARLGQVWLDAVHGRATFLDPAVARAFTLRDTSTPGSTRAVGWDTPSNEGSSIGARLGRGPLGAIGHLGFTGTSLWIDLDRELVCVLLTNRCHPSRDNQGLRAFRPRFHDAVAEALKA